MATFATIMQALYDRLGLTAQTTLVERLANQAKDKFVAAAKWPYLEYQTAFGFTTDTRQYVLGTDVGHVISLMDSAGRPLDPVHKATYEKIFLANTAAGAPSVYAVRQWGTPSRPTLHLWRAPANLSTGTLHYIKRIADGSNAQSSVGFDQIPSEHYVAIVEIAEAMFHEWEDSPQAPQLNQKANQTLAMIAQRSGAPLMFDATRQQ